MRVLDNEESAHFDLPHAGDRVPDEDVLDRVANVSLPGGDGVVALRKTDVAPVLRSLRIRHAQRQVVDPRPVGAGVGGRVGVAHGNLELGLSRRDTDRVDHALAVLEDVGLVNDVVDLTVVIHRLEIREAPADVLAAVVGTGRGERILRCVGDLQRLQSREVRLVLPTRAVLDALWAEQTVGEHLDRDRIVTGHDRRRARRSAEVRVVVAPAIAGAAGPVRAPDAIVVGGQVGLDTAVGGRSRAAASRTPRVIQWIRVIAVHDATDREDVLGPGLWSRGLVAGVRLALGPRHVMVEDDVVGVGRDRGVLCRAGIAPRGRREHDLVSLDKRLDDLPPRSRHARVRRVVELAVGCHAACVHVAAPIAEHDPGRAMAVALSRAAAPYVDRSVSKVLVCGLDAFVDVTVDPLARELALLLDVVRPALDPGVVHVELDRRPQVDPQDLVETGHLDQLRLGQADFKEQAPKLLVDYLAAETSNLENERRLVAVLVNNDDVEPSESRNVALQDPRNQFRLESERRMVVSRRANPRQPLHDSLGRMAHADDVGILRQVAVQLGAGFAQRQTARFSR